MRVIGASADEAFLCLEPGIEVGVHHVDEFLDLGHCLGADAVAGEKKEFARCHGMPLELVIRGTC